MDALFCTGPTSPSTVSTMDIDYNMPVGNMQTFYERKLSKFLIMFDNSNLLYFPGQFLSGRVIVELQDEMAITGKYLVFISEIFQLR